MAVKQKIIVDADPGIGDAVAIALSLFDPQLDVIAVTATAGRVSGSAATRNTQAVIDECDPAKWPRVGGSDNHAPAAMIDYRATAVSSSLLNGKNGLGDCELRVAEMHNLREASRLMIDLVRAAPDEITILTLGPLTNVDLACDLDPEFLGRLNGLFCLGGTVDGGGDVTAAAEFNIFADPEAARNVLRSPAPKTLIPLDVAREPVLTFDLYDRLFDPARGPLAEFLSQLLPFALRAHHQHLGLEGVPLAEVAALFAITTSQRCSVERMAIDVETAGELTRGMTVFDRRGTPQWQTNIDVVRAIDPQSVLDYFGSIVRRA